MTYLLIGSIVVLAVALWHKWANRIEQENESSRLIREARERAKERDKVRAARGPDTNLVDWDMVSQVQTAMALTSVNTMTHLTPEEAITVSTILADVDTLPTFDQTDLIVSEIDMDKEYWSKHNG